MAALVFFFSLWLICKGIKALFRSRRKVAEYAPAPAESDVTRNLAALEALQAQRDMINRMISDYQYQLDHAQLTSAQFEKTQNQLVSAYGKLATCEGKISRLCGA